MDNNEIAVMLILTDDDQNHLLGSANSSPKGILSPKSTVKTSQTASAPYHRNGNVPHLDRVTQKSLSNSSNQIERIVNNNVQLSSCLSSDTLETPKIDQINLNLHHSNKSVEALGVLIQYLVFNLDAFSNPQLKKINEITRKQLIESKSLLDDARLACGNLEEKLIEKDDYYTNREKDLQELHRCELDKVKGCISELELKLSNEEAQRNIAKSKEIELLKRISALSSTENELREKVHVSENEFGERLRAAANKERELTDKIKQLEQMNKDSENKERMLQDKLHIVQDEVVVLRNSKNLNVEVSLTSPTTPPPTQTRMLQEEIESLRCVLELKQREVSELRKQNNELQAAADSLPNALIKISGLESRLEDLQIQLKSKCDEEKYLQNKTKNLHESYMHEVSKRERLSLHNEELQWKLKQNSEKFSYSLMELAKRYPDHEDFLNDTKSSFYGQEHNSSLDVSSEKSNGTDKFGGCFHMDDISPPTSPMIKGVVQKSDSVSWVLEINDEESPEAMASRLVKRTGSFRSSFNEKYNQSQAIKRNHAQTNVLSQSASATSVLRQHSEFLPLPQHAQHSGSRRRSKSVSFKSSEPKKIIRSNSGVTRKIEIASSWNDRMTSNISPTIKRSRHTSHTKDNTRGKDLLLSEESETETTGKPLSRSNTVAGDETYSQFKRNLGFKSSTKRGLITCNASALRLQRAELYKPITTHPSVQELKKCQQIKESAGEAMVSGTNSEDEAETASSDDSVSVGSSRSSSSHSGRRRSSIEEQLMRKIVASLDSTPMEVSWSEDGDQFVNESIV